MLNTFVIERVQHIVVRGCVSEAQIRVTVIGLTLNELITVVNNSECKCRFSECP